MEGHGNRYEDDAMTGGARERKRDPVVWTPELDTIIREGYARGWSGALQAINKIQQLHPKWRSHVVWERAAQLGFAAEYVKDRPPWSAADDAHLMDFVGEHSIRALAGWLHRSRSSVRSRLWTLGQRSRVQDNYTQAGLARDLRISPKALRRWEAAGILKRRDGRITHESFRDFCKRYGSEIEYGTLDKGMQDWLKDNTDFIPCPAPATKRQAFRQHLQRVGVCPHCGRQTRGNAHERHVRACFKKLAGGRNEHSGSPRGSPDLHSSADSTTKPSAAWRHSRNEG